LYQQLLLHTNTNTNTNAEITFTAYRKIHIHDTAMDPQWTHPAMAPEQPAEEPIWWRCTRSEFIAKYQDVRGSTTSAEVDAIGEFFTHMIAKGTFPEMEPGSGSYEVLLLEDVTEIFEYFALEYANRQPEPALSFDDSLFEDGDLTDDEVAYDFEVDGLAYLNSLIGADSLLREDTLFRALLSGDAPLPEDTDEKESDEEESPLPEDSLPLTVDDLVLDNASPR
jgi:hypothetical protein